MKHNLAYGFSFSTETICSVEPYFLLPTTPILEPISVTSSTQQFVYQKVLYLLPLGTVNKSHVLNFHKSSHMIIWSPAHSSQFL